MGFTAFNLHPTVAAGVKAAGYAEPTPIQKQAIPHVLSGKDVMGLAQTGTGKTAAFALPILNRLAEAGVRGASRALVIAPTRELAEQINKSILELGSGMHVKTVTVYGGVGINPQKDKLRRGVDVIVACPGRLLDIYRQRGVNLSKVEVLVLDEADHMFDMGFLPDIRRIIELLPKKRQTLLFSATMPPEIKRLAAEVLVEPEIVQAGLAAPVSTVSHALYPVSQHLKTPLLLSLLKQTDTHSVLIFTRTKARAKRLDDRLRKNGYKAASLQGNLSQSKRQEAMDGFRSGRYDVLVATDIAARGIDVSSVSHVINYDMPNTTEAYIHRIGRTGRAAKTGDAFTFVTHEDNDMVRSIERTLKGTVERRKLEGFDYTVAATAGEAAEEKAERSRFDFSRRKYSEGKSRFSGGERKSTERESSSAGSHPAPERKFSRKFSFDKKRGSQGRRAGR
ncbi:MAG: DEAD/DEAH box helicase [Deltaproteobacteria bacterium]|nr:DEAD/DEAH box helicase [Deltaproteobacteria bacterium]